MNCPSASHSLLLSPSMSQCVICKQRPRTRLCHPGIPTAAQTFACVIHIRSPQTLSPPNPQPAKPSAPQTLSLPSTDTSEYSGSHHHQCTADADGVPCCGTHTTASSRLYTSARKKCSVVTHTEDSTKRIRNPQSKPTESQPRTTKSHTLGHPPCQQCLATSAHPPQPDMTDPPPPTAWACPTPCVPRLRSAAPKQQA